MHSDGNQSTIVPSPNPSTQLNQFGGVAAFSAEDVWAVGNAWDSNGSAKTLAAHWDGSQWSVVQTANAVTGTNRFQSVLSLGSYDAWAVGLYVSAGAVTKTLTERYWCPPAPTA